MMLTSIIAGALIGIERQWRKKIAGVRTMVLVSLGATTFVSISFMIEFDGSPTRIAAQVVSGIGFLAGGIIIRDGFNVTGLNTAATLWCTAAIGAMIGASFIKEGLLAAVVITLVNIVIRFVSYRFDQLAEVYQPKELKRMENLFLIVTCQNISEVVMRTNIITQLDRYYLSFSHFLCQDLANDRVQLQVEIEPSTNSELAMKEIIADLSKNKEVLEIYQLAKGEERW
ncbi:MgtC/SapB family protein [uncultured Enterococcus sp.]|uniref:MgtC/SapB family protein n=1 Tax=uncultured Enterococcus sp. TaxID=167972 RepID=UPI002AA6EB38|nr:MgtC/SapB family protein [uncultured Enterococcus sp.]